jgi:hypothetical protein
MTTATAERILRPAEIFCSAHRTANRWPVMGGPRGLYTTCPDCVAALTAHVPYGGSFTFSALRDVNITDTVDITAYHEAGHAVLGLLVGMPLTSAEIEPTDQGMANANVMWADDSTDAVDYMAMCWAGQVTALVRLEQLGLSTPDNRFDIVYSAWGDVDEVYRLASERRMARISGLVLAEQRVRQQWSAIARLAGELARRRMLTGAEVREIVGL